ncbi:MAG: hypothetical protein QOE11_2864, partial [Solirubrobacteraceae bacterium]|nr:hypothetical protein [Solirubrobacteraceae bacterium]
TVVVQLVVVDRQGASSAPFTTPVKLTDGSPPVVVITQPKANQSISLFTKSTKTVKSKTKGKKARKVTTRKRTRLTFVGGAKDPSGVSAVFITLERLSVAPKKKAKKKKARSAATTAAAKRCIWLEPKTGFVSRSCDKPVLIRTGVRQGTWAYRLASRIKTVAGTYRVSVYGTDGAGAFGNSAAARDRIVRFTVKG